MQKSLMKITVYLMILLLGFSLNSGFVAAATGTAQVVIIPVEGEIEPGMASFLERSLDKAEQMGASKVILQIDTPGGFIDAAKKMKTRIFQSKVPTVALINGEAKSAGVLIALAAEKVYMTPGTSIGAAEPVPNNPKILASWKSDLEEAAEARGRDPRLVAGMADKNVVIEGVKEKGAILSLTANRAVDLNLVDDIVPSRDALLTELSRADGVHYEVVELEPGFGEKLAWWIVNPFISPILLLVGFMGLLAEAFTLGWGLAGTVGLIALGLFFGGHMMAGVAGWLAVLVFILGVIALMLEIFIIPGFGAAGLIGLGLIIWSIFLASTSPLQAVISLTVAFVGSIILLYFLVKVLGRRGVFDRLILGNKMDKETGYVAPKKELEKYQGMEGVAITPLRPSGTAEIAGDRVDVVAEGSFIPANTKIKVVLIEGGRVVVRNL